MMRVFTNGQVYTILLVISFVLASQKPEWGIHLKLMSSGLLTDGLIVLIFLIQGLRLKTASLREVWSKPASGIAFQLSILLVPICWVILGSMLDLIKEEVENSFLYIAILPTTISTCIVYSHAAGGDSDYSLGHATISNLLAPIVITFLGSQIIDIGMVTSFGFVITKILWCVLLPSLVGWLISRSSASVRLLAIHDFFTMLPLFSISFIVFLTFCEGFHTLGTEVVWKSLKFTFLPCLGFVIALHVSGWFLSGMWSRERNIRISQFFCLSQKSLAMGMPLAIMLFAGSSASLIKFLMPLFWVHFVQLLTGAMLLGYLSRWVHKEAITQ
jgi:sodium/bile acid cotransporter 7